MRWLWMAALLGSAACSSQAPSDASRPAVNLASDHLPIEPLVTLQDLMREEVDASADALWDAVGSVTTRDSGTIERQPHSDLEWAAARQHAVVLLESSNLLVIPGRQVTVTPFASDGPGVYSSAQIQDRLDHHRPEFDALALGLRAVARDMLAAIDAKDAAALQRAGGALDAACEACHLANWYPSEVIPALPSDPSPPP